jgi:hypothetical protein
VDRIALGVKPEGEIAIRLKNRDGETWRRFSNIVTDQGWVTMIQKINEADGAMAPKFLRFGLSDEEPSRADTSLIQPAGPIKGHTSITYGGLVNAGQLIAYSTAFIRFDFAPGELSGQRWAELGLSYNSNGTSLYNRALIRDENGVPVPLVCLPDQSVTVWVRLRLYLNGWGTPVNIGGVTGTIAMNSGGAQSTTSNMWVRGLPLWDATMAGITSQRERFNPPSVQQYFAVGPSGSWSASEILFRGRGGQSFMSISLSPFLTRPVGHMLQWRIQLTIERAPD